MCVCACVGVGVGVGVGVRVGPVVVCCGLTIQLVEECDLKLDGVMTERPDVNGA